MKLLIITQKIDMHDSVLGFFHRWIQEFAKQFSKITVIALGVGRYHLPENVRVFSLGKEKNVSQGTYILNFYTYIWRERKNYDAVFVHMNQEYVLLGGLLWKMFGKRIFLWRNHAKGNFLTSLAVFLSDKVFCTSSQSYTARFKKTQIMPAGIDTDFFKPDHAAQRRENSILFLGRISPVKKVLEFIDWLYHEKKKGKFFQVTIAGSVLLKDVAYEKKVREKVAECGLVDEVSFLGTVTQEEALKLYQSHEVYINFTPSGSFDKTILEAAACETSVIVKNDNLKMLERKKGKALRDFVVEHHSLKFLCDKLQNEIISK